MSSAFLVDYIYITLFILVGFLVVVAPFVVSHLVRPRSKNHKKTLQTYECGMDPLCSTKDFRYGISFYVYAVIFLAFDVDVVYLFPVAAAFNAVDGMRGVIELFIFIGILSMAIVYAWSKGVFEWEKKKNIR